MAEEIDVENEGFPTVKGSWPWPCIGSYCIPSCIAHRPLPTCQISLIWKKLFVDGWTDIWDLTNKLSPDLNWPFVSWHKRPRPFDEHRRPFERYDTLRMAPPKLLLMAQPLKHLLSDSGEGQRNVTSTSQRYGSRLQQWRCNATIDVLQRTTQQ